MYHAIMTRETPYPRWIAAARYQACGFALLGIAAAAVASLVDTSFPRPSMLAGLAAILDTATPWVVGIAGVWTLGWLCWWASTYLWPDWWAVRWARAQGYAVE